MEEENKQLEKLQNGAMKRKITGWFLLGLFMGISFVLAIMAWGLHR